MPQDWVDVSITTDLDAGDLLSLLDDPFVQGAWQDERTLHLYWPGDRWNADQLAWVRATLRRFDSTGSPAELSVQQIPHQDWNRLWAESVKPLRVGHRIVIRPSWEPVELQSGDVEMILDPKQAFGTGHHATTKLLLEWLEESIRGGESVLDVGTGSGILAMVALKLGAARAVGIDNDPVAIECAKENALLNHCGPALTVSTQSLDDFSDQRFDVVVANLDRQTLLELGEPVAVLAQAGARLLVSGLLLDQESEIVHRYAEEGLYVSQRREQDGWLALELLVTDSCEGSGA